MSLEGVETNSVSRFIDHSFSTDWERFIGDIEIFLKENKKILKTNNDNDNDITTTKTLEYSGSKYIIKYHNNSSKKNNKDISLWFNETRYILITGDLYNWTDNSLSLCHTLFSAFIIALSTTNTIDIPVFFTLSPMERINNSKLLMGYKILSYKNNDNISINLASIHYESHLLDYVDNKNDLYYLDGIKTVCINKLNTFSVGYIEHDQILLNVNINEDYTYKYERKPFDDSNNIEYNNNIKNRNNSYDYIPIPFLESLNPSPILLKKLNVRLQYPNITLGSNGNLNLIIDNQNYTTLIPSKQSNNCWNMSCTFTSPTTTLTKSDNHISLIKNGSLSLIIRRLLGFYIYGKSFRLINDNQKSTTKDDNKQFSHSNQSQYSYDNDLVTQILDLLSNQTRDVVSEVCTFNDKVIPSRSNSRSNSRSRSQSRSLSVSVSESGSPAVSNDDYDDIDDKIKHTHQIRHFLSCLFNSAMVDNEESDNSDNGNIANNNNNTNDLRGSTHHTHLKENDDTAKKVFDADLWLSLCSLYVGSMDGNATLMSELWHSCTKELRKRWETGLPFSHINRSLSKTISPNIANNINNFDMDKPIWEQTLWEEVIYRNNLENINAALPDLNQSLLTQKIQMIQMCIVLKDEDSICDAPSSMQNTVVSFPNVSMNTREYRAVNTPKLLRRLPMTMDAIAIHQHMIQKITSGQSSSSKQSLLRWQILMPSIVSDIKSFKSCNIEADSITFMEWYINKDNVFPYPNELQYLAEVYESCNPVSASDQKVMFQAEGEAEKAFSTIDKLTHSEISTEILLYSLNSIYILLIKALKEYCLWNYEDNSKIDTSISSFDNDLFSLRNDIDKVIEMINMNICGVKKNDVSNSYDNNDNDDSICILIDSIAAKVEILEEQAARAKEISDFFDISSSLEKCHIITSLCKEGYVVPNNNLQLQIIFNTAKKISKGSGSHNWHSHDGREFGVPTKKHIDIHCQKLIKLTDAYDNHTQPSNNDQVMKHHFTVIAENNKLRLSSNITEHDN